MSISILVVAFTDLSTDPRVRRQLIALKDRFHVTAVGTKSPQMEGVKFLSCKTWEKSKLEKLKTLSQLVLRRYDSLYWQSPIIEGLKISIKQEKYDVIIANDIETLPFALDLAKKCGAKVLFDAHEYAPKEFEDVFYWKLLYQPYKTYLCKKYMAEADQVMTVCDGIAEEYLKNFNVSCKVVTNACAYASDIVIHEADAKKIKMVFHGAATPSRKLENIIEIMNLLDERFYLDFYLVGNQAYIEKLKKACEGNSHIQFKEPVPYEGILNMLRQYDVGLYLLEPNSFNNKMALPNKLFEFVQARLMIAIGPSPEMSKLIRKYNCGVVADDFKPQSLADALNKLSAEDIQAYKRNAETMAMEQCFEKNSMMIIEMINKLVKVEK